MPDRPGTPEPIEPEQDVPGEPTGHAAVPKTSGVVRSPPAASRKAAEAPRPPRPKPQPDSYNIDGGDRQTAGEDPAGARPITPVPVSAARRAGPSTPSGQGQDEGSELQVGSVIDGKYTLTRLLGEGGMGSVFAAHNELLDADVAIKVMHSASAGAQDDELAGRLLQEARAAARLEHPAITRVFDIGVSDDGDPYIVMELLKGETLGTIIERRGHIDPVKAVQTILPVAHALAAAHEKNIVHRDIKADNVFLAVSENGVQPKLIDFGVAKGELKVAMRLTGANTLVGTPEYMSPEQALGQDVHAATDIWSLCVVLYEMLCGEVPFHDQNYNALMRSIAQDPHAPLVTVGVDDPELSAIVDRGLAKQQADRWPSMRHLGQALARWLMSRGVDQDVCGDSLCRTWLQDGATPHLPEDVLASVPPARGSAPELGPRPGPRPAGAAAPAGAALAQDDAPNAADRSFVALPGIGRVRRSVLLGGLGIAAIGVIAAVVALRATGPGTDDGAGIAAPGASAAASTTAVASTGTSSATAAAIPPAATASAASASASALPAPDAGATASTPSAPSVKAPGTAKPVAKPRPSTAPELMTPTF